MSRTPTPQIPLAANFAEIDSDSFRTAMRELAGGVAVVTVGRDGDVTGFTAARSYRCARAHRGCWFASLKTPLPGASSSDISTSA